MSERGLETGPLDDQAEALLVGLVERPSLSRQEGPAVRYLVEQMQALGFHAYVDGAGSAVGEIGEGERTILLLGHIDTVPGVIPVQRRGRSLYGRGTVDAKGPLAAFTAAAARAGARAGWRTIVVGAVEEEAATSKGARYLLDRLQPDMVIIGEPSGWERVTVGYKGRLLVDYRLDAQVTHTSGPEPTVCEQAVAFWQQIAAHARAWNEGRERMFDQLTPSLRQIQSESDGLVERVRMTVGFRLPLDADVEALQEQMRAFAGEAAISWRGQESAYRASRTTSLARAFIRAIRARGGQSAFTVKSGTSDMNVVGPAWNCPILAYGPGDSGLDHTPQEHIDLDEYQRAIAVLVQVLHDLQAGAGSGPSK